MQNRKLELKGIVPPMVTPLIDNDTLDKAGTEKLIEHMLAGGIHGLFILGTTGEAPSLSYAVRYELIKLVCEKVAGRVPVLVGITDTSISESIRLANHAAACGAAALVSAPPYYFAPAQQELIEYYTELADALPLPLYLYNMPSHVKVIFDPQTVRILSEHPNIIVLKDSSANMVYFQSLLHIMRDKPDFALFVGPEELTAESVMMGAAGGVNGGANMFPKLYVDLYDAAVARDLDKVRELQNRVMEISTTLYKIGKYGSSFLKGVKCSLSLMGICSDFAAAPFHKFRTEERNKAREILEKLNVKIVNP